jgi:septal ring factor EnvC (AmiA/AmiB activator)
MHRTWWSAGAAAVAGAVAAATLTAQAPVDSLRKRANDRLAGLRHEAETLASQEQTILVELRKLEVDREIKAARLAEIEHQVADVQTRLDEATTRAEALARQSELERPGVEARLVRLYKMGRAGYWRMLLDVDSLREMGRAYRTASALNRIDRERAEQHRRTLEALERERATLKARATDLEHVRKQAADARTAVDRAVAARNALVKSIDARRDLNAQLTGELQQARDRLQSEVNRMQTDGAAVVGLPIRPFQGVLPWPADGVPLRRRGVVSQTAANRNGVELSLAEGQPVKAVHEGLVAFADSFTGYGNLVIIDHGERAFSLYGDLSSLTVQKGDQVSAGTTLGLSGRDLEGNPALYFELRIDGRSVDPVQWLKRR